MIGNRDQPAYVRRAALWMLPAGISLAVAGLAADPTVTRIMIAVCSISLLGAVVEVLIGGWRERRRRRR